jgi:hypothetical protein
VLKSLKTKWIPGKDQDQSHELLTTCPYRPNELNFNNKAESRDSALFYK